MNAEWPATDLALAIDGIDRNVLVEEYEDARRAAPRRHDQGRMYFVPGHDGRLRGEAASGRFEEHLAMAIWRLQAMRWPRPAGGWFRILDYQFPLQAARANRRVGKIDLLGITDRGRLLVSELKVAPAGGRGKSPMAALMQGLRYAAVVDANKDAIGREAVDSLEVPTVSTQRPIVQILAPKTWWQGWFQLEDSTRKKAGPWERSFAELTADIENRLDVAVECLAMDDVQKAKLYQRAGEPTLPTVPTMYAVQLGESGGVGAALQV